MVSPTENVRALVQIPRTVEDAGPYRVPCACASPRDVEDAGPFRML